MLKAVQIGYGYWGANIAQKLIASKEFDLVGLCEVDEKRQLRAGEVLPESVVIEKDYRIFLNDNTIQAFIIATQTEFSFTVALDAMKSGKHIFIEKPIATTTNRAIELQKIAKENNLIIHCDHIMLYHPVIRQIKRMIENDELGKILYIDVSRLNLGPVRKDVNAMLDLAVHDLAVIDFLSDGEKALHLSAFGETAIGNQETLTYLTIQYSEFVAHIKSSWVSPVKERRTIIAGTKKMVVFDDMLTNKLTIYDCGLEVKQGSEYGSYEFLARTGDIFIPNIPFEDSLQNSLEHFASCIYAEKESLSGAEHSIRVMRILEAAMKELDQKK